MLDGFLGGFLLVVFLFIGALFLRAIIKIFNLSKSLVKKTIDYQGPISKEDEEVIFGKIADEIKNLNTKDSLYTKAYMISKGDKKKAEVEYIKLRKNELYEEIKKERIQLALEAEKKAKEEKIRLKKQRNLTLTLLVIGIFFLIFILPSL